MSEQARVKKGFGEFFLGTFLADEGVKQETGEEVAPELSDEGARRAPLQGSAEELSAIEQKSTPVIASKLFLPVESKPVEVSEPKAPKGIFQLQFDESSNPVVTKIYGAFLAQGITAEQIVGTKTMVTASDVLAYLDKNFSRPLVQKALKSPDIGFIRPPWLNRKGKILPEYASKEFRTLSFSQKIAYVHAYKAEKASGEKKELHLKHAIWFDPTNVARHRALGKAAVARNNYQLAQLAYYNASQLDPKGPSVEVALREASLAHNLKQYATASDPLQKVFYEIRIDLLQDNLSGAKLKMLAFKEQTAGSQDTKTVAQRDEVRTMLRSLTLQDVSKLTEANETLKAQRQNNLESKYYSEKSAAQNDALLSLCTEYLTQGRADTLDECIALFQSEHEKLQKEFWLNPVIEAAWSVTLPYKAPRYGTDAYKAERAAAVEFSKAFKANPNDPALLEKSAHPGVPFVRLEGGLLNIPANQAPAIRVVIGKAGGHIKMGELTYSFPPSATEHVIMLTPAFLSAPQLRRHKDYQENSHFGAPVQAKLATTRDLKDGHPEALSSLLEHWKHIDVRDRDFKILFDLQTKAGWEKTANPELKRQEMLKTAEELRHRNGSYLITAEILEELFTKDLQQAISEITPEQMKEIRKGVDKNYAKVGLQVSKELMALKESQPELYAKRFPGGNVSEEDFDAMVQQALETKIAMQVRKVAFAIIDAKHEAGQISDPIAAKAWALYEDLKDPLDRTWNMADESWDRIIDEVVITAVTLPLTMGVGTLVRSSLSATTLALRLSAQGGVRAFGTRAAIFTVGAVTEGFVQEGLSSTVMGTEFRIANAGLNCLMSGAFHGGGKLWAGAAESLGVGELAIQAAKNQGGKVLGKTIANTTGSLATQTVVATSMTYVEDLFHETAPRTFWERLGGSAVRMIGYNFATKRLNMATGDMALRAEKLGQARLKYAEKRAGELRKSGVAKKTAEETAVAEAKKLTWDAKQENIVLSGEEVKKEKALFAGFFEEHAKREAEKNGGDKATDGRTAVRPYTGEAVKDSGVDGDTTPPAFTIKDSKPLYQPLKANSPKVKAKIAEIREMVAALAELSGLPRLQDKGAITEWALENGMTPEKLTATRDQILAGKIILDIENGMAVIKLIPEENQVRQREIVENRIPTISSSQIDLIGEGLIAPKEVGVAEFVPMSQIADKAAKIEAAKPNAERIARYVDHLMKNEKLSRESAEAKAQAWAEKVILDARAYQASRTQIYDTSLPVGPATAHLDGSTIDHHGRFENPKNATEQLLDRMESALKEVRGDKHALFDASKDLKALKASGGDLVVAAALRKLNIQQVTTDNLADGAWCVWIAKNQAAILKNPKLRALIAEATHFEDFTAFGTQYDQTAPGVRLQAALFQKYGEILNNNKIFGMDRFTPEQSTKVMGEALAVIEKMVSDPTLREATAKEFFSKVEAAHAIATRDAIMDGPTVQDGATYLTFFDVSKLFSFSLFQQWLALPRVETTSGQPHQLQVSVIPKDAYEKVNTDGTKNKIPRYMQIVAIPNGRNLPSKNNLTSPIPTADGLTTTVQETFNRAELAKAEALGLIPKERQEVAPGQVPRSTFEGMWVGKDAVIFPIGARGGTLLTPAEVSGILRDPALGLFEGTGTKRAPALVLLKSQETEKKDSVSTETVADRVSAKKLNRPSDEVTTDPLLPLAARKAAELKVKPADSAKGKVPVQPGDVNETGQLVAPNGKGFVVGFEDSNILYLGKNEESGALNVSGKNLPGLQAEIAAVKDGDGKVSFEIRPLGEDPVFLVGEAEQPVRVYTKGQALVPGQIIQIGDQSLIWNPPGSSLKSGELGRLYRNYFESTLYPRKLELVQKQNRGLHEQVEVLNATDQIISKNARPSFGAMEYPELAHLPVKVVTSDYLKASEMLRDYQREGSLRDLPVREYHVDLTGMQRYRDTLARLKAKYGRQLEVELDLANETHMILRSDKGEALVQIVLRGKERKAPSEAQMKEALAALDVFKLDQWQRENSRRGMYAYRLLNLIGAKKERGAFSYGSELAGLVKKMKQAKDPAERARVGEQLAVAYAYLQDAPMVIEEQALLHDFRALEDDVAVRNGVVWMKEKNPRLAATAQKILLGVDRKSDTLRTLGEKLRLELVPEKRVSGQKLFDEYMAARKEVESGKKALEGVKLVYLKNSGVVKKEPDAEDFVVSEEVVLPPAGLTLTSVRAKEALATEEGEVTKVSRPSGGLLGLGFGLVSLLHAGSARAAEQADVAASGGNNSPLYIGVGIGVGALVGLGVWLFRGRLKSTLETGETFENAKTLVNVKIPLDEEGIAARTKKVEKTPLPKTEMAEPLAEPFIASIAAADINDVRFAQNKSGKNYGPHAIHTHKGIGTKVADTDNQDSFVQGGDWAGVFDGMGGMGISKDAGQRASRLAAEAIARYMEAPGSKKDLGEALLAGADAINQSDWVDGGAAVGVLHRIVPTGDGEYVAEIANVGDAGAMIFRKNAWGDLDVVFETKEQSVVAIKRDKGELQNTLMMRIDPKANQVKGGMGGGVATDPLTYRVPLKKGDQLVMLSDGIGDNLSKQELASLLKGAKTPEEAVDRIIKATLKKMDTRDTAQGAWDGRRYAAINTFVQNQAGKTVPAVELPSGYLMDERGVIYHPTTKQPVDFYKSDNLAVHVYSHEPVEIAPERKKAVIMPKVDIADMPTKILTPEKTLVLQPKPALKAHQKSTGQWWIPEGVSPFKIGAHAEIKFAEGEFWLKNLSRYVIRVNGESIEPGQATALESGHMVNFSGISYQTGFADGALILTKALVFAPQKTEIHIGNVSIRKNSQGKFYIRNAETGTEVSVGKTPIPYDAKNYHQIKDGEEVRIGGKVYIFRGE